ncbi:nucleotidyltransferase domain-containing protein [Mucilaginibacter sp. BT774]|uniref:nucleotidyltransferase domain-containing protein n=1 Tax=Mucilaginibacter sp. BT774 TaxID=3062276 RepID=UPI0026747487|nr:nucleotidyltransferase domain-containing protein [Mucilaginibacter sp. BT774]MDO3624773.1 nucleotidyltransferase domain-containing protein [Mucilaginibacter sp. BT774]
MHDLRKQILSTIAYFDLFHYPLTAEEIYLSLPVKCDTADFEYGLKYLVIDRMIYHFDKFYALKNEYFLVERRLEGNARAAKLTDTAKKVSNLLVRFPFVRGIAISGSLSKNFADEDSDIDLFIITAKNRLWIARTLMHCFKKLTFLVKREHYFCMNYYIDEEELQIREKNIYTAIEIATLIPLHGDSTFEHFYAANNWTRNYLPNKYMRLSTAKTLKPSWLKKAFEWLFSNRLGNASDSLLMRITAERWDKKRQQKKLNIKGLIMGMDTGKHYAKPDPKNFQEKLILKYQLKLSQILEQWEGSAVN